MLAASGDEVATAAKNAELDSRRLFEDFLVLVELREGGSLCRAEQRFQPSIRDSAPQ